MAIKKSAEMTRTEELENIFREFLLLFFGTDDKSAEATLDTQQLEMLEQTPRRFVHYLEEYNNETLDALNAEPEELTDLEPGELDVAAIMKVGFDLDDKSGNGQMVVQTGIPMRAVCAHHLLPFFGEVSIGYIAKERVCGLSKLPRLVAALSTRRPCMQEQLTTWIADAINESLHPQGVIVVISATHTCMTSRGVVARGSQTTTSTLRGVYLTVPAARDEFFALADRRHTI